MTAKYRRRRRHAHIHAHIYVLYKSFFFFFNTNEKEREKKTLSSGRYFILSTLEGRLVLVRRHLANPFKTVSMSIFNLHESRRENLIKFAPARRSNQMNSPSSSYLPLGRFEMTRSLSFYFLFSFGGGESKK